MILSSMDVQLRPIIRQKILDAEGAPSPVFTRRDVHVPAIPNDERLAELASERDRQELLRG